MPYINHQIILIVNTNFNLAKNKTGRIHNQSYQKLYNSKKLMITFAYPFRICADDTNYQTNYDAYPCRC